MQKKTTKVVKPKPKPEAKQDLKPLAPCDEVYRTDSDLKTVWVILSISPNEPTATIYLKGTDLQWFRYPLEKLARAV